MAIHVLGESGVVFFGPRSSPNSVRWWAENGLIHYEDDKDGAYEALSIREFLTRLNAVNDTLESGKRTRNQGFLHHDELDRQMRFVEAGIELARKAKEQRARMESETKKVQLAMPGKD